MIHERSYIGNFPNKFSLISGLLLIGRLGKRWGKVGCVVPSSGKRTVTDRGEPSEADCDGFRGEKALGLKRLIAPW